MTGSETLHTVPAQSLAEQVREARIDFEAFRTRLRVCDLSRCRATCCHDGVRLSEEEAEALADRIQEHRATLGTYGVTLEDSLHRDALGWKTRAVTVDRQTCARDFPAHFPATRCAFLDGEHRCAWQRLAGDHQLPAWYYKPLTCWLHPLLMQPPAAPGDRPLLTLARPEADPQSRPGYPGFASCTHCGRPDAGGVPASQALAGELAMLSRLSGRDLRAEIDAPAADW